ncbi:hypothetical protein NL676_034232 [Syzygium grande]|nr:hypothetical protein NL676_034232 [Syzygium grande]
MAVRPGLTADRFGGLTADRSDLFRSDRFDRFDQRVRSRVGSAESTRLAPAAASAGHTSVCRRELSTPGGVAVTSVVLRRPTVVATTHFSRLAV